MIQQEVPVLVLVRVVTLDMLGEGTAGEELTATSTDRCSH